MEQKKYDIDSFPAVEICFHYIQWQQNRMPRTFELQNVLLLSKTQLPTLPAQISKIEGLDNIVL